MKRSLGRFACDNGATSFRFASVGSFVSMPLADVPHNVTVALPVPRWRTNAAISALNLDVKIVLLESSVLCDV